MSALLGRALALLSAAALNCGFFAQHTAADAAAAVGSAPRRLAVFAVSLRTWLAGFLCGLAGWALDLSALALAPLSLVQACSAGGSDCWRCSFLVAARSFPTGNVSESSRRSPGSR